MTVFNIINLYLLHKTLVYPKNYSDVVILTVKDSFGDSPLFDAINQGKEGAIEVLLQVPALNRHALNGKGFNMLHQACLQGSVR